MRGLAEDLAAGLAASGWDVQLLTRRVAAPRGRLPALAADLQDGFRAGRRARGAVLNLHVGGPRRMAPMLIAARLAGCRRVIVTLHGAGSRVRWPRHRRLVARLAHALVVPSAGAGRLNRDAGLAPPRLVVRPHGIVPLPSVPRAEARRRLGLPEDAFVVAFAARFVPEKGLSTLIEALAALPGALLVAAGDGPARASLEGAAARALPGRHLFTGWLDRDGMASLLAAADVLAVPSARESFGTTAVEAALAGCPVVASDLPAIREATADGEAALLVPPGDPAALRSALLRLRDDPALRARLAAAARDAARDFSLEAMVRGYAALLTS
jgi:glycosyltransferase involved in cell wall biosynthesis